MFEPTMPKLPMASGDIRSGRYELAADRGPAPGSYLVRFKAYRKKKDPHLDKHPYVGDDQEVGVVREQFLPKQYSADPSVTVEIKSDGDGIYNFTLEK